MPTPTVMRNRRVRCLLRPHLALLRPGPQALAEFRGARLTMSVLLMLRYEAKTSWQFLAAAFSENESGGWCPQPECEQRAPSQFAATAA
jgi:hypothetical protein